MSDLDHMKNGHRPPERRFFGRRKGKAFSSRQQGLMDTLLPRISVKIPENVALSTVTPKTAKKATNVTLLRPADIFGEKLGKTIKQVWLEIGFGKGEHLAWQAQANPDIGLIGCEPYLNGVVGLLAHIEANEIENIRIYGDDARHVIWALPDASIDRIFLIHPDPWPKKKHARRRFINPWNLDDLARILKDGGEFRVGTDHPIYREWTNLQMAGRDDFIWTAEGPDDWQTRPGDWPETRYEVKAIEGKATYFRFRRVARG
jgi:tRNA (guanine-N7-)-methyltransferase